MAQTTEIENLVVRLGLDAKPYARGLKKSSAATGKYVRDINGKLRDARGRFVDDHRIMAESTARLGFGLKKLQRVTAAYSVQLKTLGTTAMATGRQLTLGLTAPLAIVGGLSVRAFAKFDQAMTESTSIMKVTAAETEAMKKQALDLARVAPQGPEELAKSYFFLASAGKNAEQSMALLPKVMAFSTAGAFDMSLATDLLTDAQSALGMSSKNVAVDTANLTLISDSLVKANTLANASVQQFAESLTSDAATASQSFGQELSTTMAILALYADKGKKAAESGNLFGRATRLLTKASRDNATVFEKFNIKVVDKATGKYRTFVEILDDMNVAFASMSKPEIGQALSDLGFEALAQKSILPLLNSTEALEAYLAQFKKVGDVTKDVSEKQLKSFSNQMKIAKNNVSVMGISIGEQLAPKLHGLGVTVASLTRGFEGLSGTSKAVIVNTGLLLATIGPLTLAFGGLVRMLGFVSASIATTTRGFRIMRVAMARTTLTANLLKVAVLGLKVAAAGAIAFGSFKIGQQLAGAAAWAKKLNDERERGLKLTAAANRNVARGTAGLLQASQEQAVGGARRSFLTEELERAQKAVSEYERQIKQAQATADSLEPSWLSLQQWGKTVWKEHVRGVEDLISRSDAAHDRVRALAAALGKANIDTAAKIQEDEAAKRAEVADAKRLKSLRDRRKEINAYIRNLMIENKVMLATADGAELYRLRVKGASGPQIKALERQFEIRRELQKELDLRDANKRKTEATIALAKKRADRLKADAKAIIKAQRTPLKIFTDEVMGLQELLNKGLLNQTQFAMARDEASKEMEELKKQLAADTLTIPVQFKLVTGRLAGSTQAIAELEDIAFRAVQEAGRKAKGAGGKPPVGPPPIPGGAPKFGVKDGMRTVTNPQQVPSGLNLPPLPGMGGVGSGALLGSMPIPHGDVTPEDQAAAAALANKLGVGGGMPTAGPMEPIPDVSFGTNATPEGTVISDGIKELIGISEETRDATVAIAEKEDTESFEIGA